MDVEPEDVLAAATERSGVADPLGQAFDGVVIEVGPDAVWLKGLTLDGLSQTDVVVI